MGADGQSREESLLALLAFENVNRCVKDPQRRMGVQTNSSGLRVGTAYVVGPTQPGE